MIAERFIMERIGKADDFILAWEYLDIRGLI